MKIKSILILLIIFFSLNANNVFAQEPNAAPQPAAAPAQQDTMPAQAAPEPPRQIPPAIVLQGKETEYFNKVFIEKAKVGQPLIVKFLMFDMDPTEELKSKIYNLPKSATYEFKLEETAKNRASSVLTWTPKEESKADKDEFDVIIVEAKNSKGLVSRIAVAYDVEK